MKPLYDLIYAGDKALYVQMQSEITANFPNAVFEDASDWLHPDRFNVSIEGVEQKDWYLWLLRNGWFGSSFDFQYASMDNQELVLPLMRQVVAEKKGAVKP